MKIKAFVFVFFTALAQSVRVQAQELGATDPGSPAKPVQDIKVDPALKAFSERVEKGGRPIMYFDGEKAVLVEDKASHKPSLQDEVVRSTGPSIVMLGNWGRGGPEAMPPGLIPPDDVECQKHVQRLEKVVESQKILIEALKKELEVAKAKSSMEKKPHE